MPKKPEKNLLKTAIKTSSRRNTPMASAQNSDDELTDYSSIGSENSDDTYMNLDFEEQNLADNEHKTDPGEAFLTAIDNVTDKRTKTREESLSKIVFLLRHNYMVDELEDQQETLFKALRRCMAKGQSTSEKVMAALAMSLLVVSLDPDDDEMFEDLEHGMFKVARDSDDHLVQSAYLQSLVLICFFSSVDHHGIISLLHQILDLFEDDELDPGFLATALNSVGLLCAALKLKGHSEHVKMIFLKSVDYHVDFLDHADTFVRIASGENLAIFYEIMQANSTDPDYRYLDDVVAKMNLLQHDHKRYKSKKDRRHQRAAFRDIIPTLESGDKPNIRLTFRSRNVYIRSWCQIRQLQQYRALLQGGFHIHMSQNPAFEQITDPALLEMDDDDERIVNPANSALSKTRAMEKAAMRHSRREYLEGESDQYE